MIPPESYDPPLALPIGRGGYLDIYDPEQRDHHCYLCAGGVTWRVYAMEGAEHVLLRAFREDGHCVVSEWDLSGLRIDEYARKALELDYAANP